MIDMETMIDNSCKWRMHCMKVIPHMERIKLENIIDRGEEQQAEIEGFHTLLLHI